MKRTLITNIGMLATPQGTAARGGRAQGEICILKNAWILIENDLIAQVGTGAAPAAAQRAEQSPAPTNCVQGRLLFA